MTDVWSRFRRLVWFGVFFVPAAAFGQSPDVAAGERVYRQCAVCHDVITPAGERLAGRGSSAGPNLYGIFGQPAASVPGYRYSESLERAGRTGLVWNGASMVDYLLDPIGFTQDLLGDPAARSQMSYRLNSPQDAANVVAYLRSLEN